MVPVENARRWADKMKELAMTYEYIEIKDGDHIRPAITELPEIFDFFATNASPSKGSRESPSEGSRKE